VRVHRDEDIASHIGPEPCAGIRDDVGEASVGERVGQPLSPEITFLGLPTRLVTRKAKPEARNRERYTGPDGVAEPEAEVSRQSRRHRVRHRRLPWIELRAVRAAGERTFQLLHSSCIDSGKHVLVPSQFLVPDGVGNLNGYSNPTSAIRPGASCTEHRRANG
jgi:hypothetical protein